MEQIEQIKEKLIELKPYLREKYKVKTIGVFGSYVRGEQKKRSDVDILVEFDETPGLLGYLGLENYLSDAIGVKVDLVMKDALKPRIGKHILEEVVYV